MPGNVALPSLGHVTLELDREGGDSLEDDSRVLCRRLSCWMFQIFNDGEAFALLLLCSF